MLEAPLENRHTHRAHADASSGRATTKSARCRTPRNGLNLSPALCMFVTPAAATRADSNGTIETAMALRTLTESHVEAMCAPGQITSRTGHGHGGQKVELKHVRQLHPYTKHNERMRYPNRQR
jgi:hypothetical protein